MEESAIQSNSRPWLYKKGQSGNPSGKPKGTISLKTWVKNKIQTMSEEEREEFLEGMDKKEIWKMAEGLPQQDITSAGEAIIPKPLLNYVWNNHSDKQDTTVKQENKDNTGGNISKQDCINTDLPNLTSTVGQDTNSNEHSVGVVPPPT